MARLSSLDLCTDEEKLVLIAIATLAKSLANPSSHYINALGDITSKFTAKGGGGRGDHNPMPGSLKQTHDVRAFPKYGTPGYQNGVR